MRKVSREEAKIAVSEWIRANGGEIDLAEMFPAECGNAARGVGVGSYELVFWHTDDNDNVWAENNLSKTSERYFSFKWDSLSTYEVEEIYRLCVKAAKR